MIAIVKYAWPSVFQIEMCLRCKAVATGCFSYAKKKLYPTCI